MPTYRMVLIKKGNWRGAVEEWSNGYCLTGTAPPDKPAAKALATALYTAESNFYITQPLIQWYYYEDTGEKTTVKYGEDLRATPIEPAGGAYGAAYAQFVTKASLEQVAHIRGQCGYTSKGKPKYVHKFFHGVPVNGSNQDKVDWKSTGVPALLGKFTDGTLPQGAKVSNPAGTVCEPFTIDPWLGTRTLKRRGKRPSRSSQG